MLKQNTINLLKSSRNLLAFSAGVDSSALFFLLLKNDIPFDIAIVDYNLRAASKDEVSYARELAAMYDKKIYERSVVLTGSNFEAEARNVRYDFFRHIIATNSYDTLLTAHQLNDKTEWLLMKLCSGSGISSMSGMDEIENGENYRIVRPIINTPRVEIEKFLQSGGIKYFLDESNNDEKYTRNYFRKNFSNLLVSEFASGIAKSFEILSDEKDALYGHIKIFQEQQLLVSNPKSDIEILYILDKSLKKLGYVISSWQREEFLKSKNCVFGGKLAAVFQNERLFVSPVESTVMDKKFKEQCRLVDLPSKIRPYLFGLNIEPLLLSSRINLFFVS